MALSNGILTHNDNSICRLLREHVFFLLLQKPGNTLERVGAGAKTEEKRTRTRRKKNFAVEVGKSGAYHGFTGNISNTGSRGGSDVSAQKDPSNNGYAPDSPRLSWWSARSAAASRAWRRSSWSRSRATVRAREQARSEQQYLATAICRTVHEFRKLRGIPEWAQPWPGIEIQPEYW